MDFKPNFGAVVSVSENQVAEIVPLDSYNIEEGKLRASIKWIITKVYEANIPDQLINPFYRDDTMTLQLSPAALNSLTSGVLYCQTAAKIFQDQSFLQQSHAVVIQALQRACIDVVDGQEEQRITETMLTVDSPWKQTAHLAMIDALMTANLKQIITIDKAVEAVKQYTCVDKREEPMDPVDALLFWINKICLLVRDDMEKMSISAQKTVENPAIVPEMEDLYEDLCDGACVCALIAFYRPQQLNMEAICFNDPMGIGDCVYNLGLLKQFCSCHLPCDIFHFSTEDILYLHENFQPNVNAFLADLFHHFEDENVASQSVKSPPLSSNFRRFSPIRVIPDLRRQNVKDRHPPPVRLVKSTAIPSASSSLMNSMDSLTNNRTCLPSGLVKSPTTHFGALAEHRRQQLRQFPLGTSSDMTQSVSYTRSDSMPTRAGIRLAMEEKRREMHKRNAIASSQQAADRQRKGKDAFFQLMGNKQHESPQPNVVTSHQNGSPMKSPIMATHDNQRMEHLSRTLQTLQAQVEKMSVQQQQLALQIDEKSPIDTSGRISHAVSQPLVFVSPQQYTVPIVPSQYDHCSNGTVFVLDSDRPQTSATFRLHDDQAAPSRLDPPLELNRNLTNWGLTYKSGQKVHRRTWNESEGSREVNDKMDTVQKEIKEVQLIGNTQTKFESPSQTYGHLQTSVGNCVPESLQDPPNEMSSSICSSPKIVENDQNFPQKFTSLDNNSQLMDKSEKPEKTKTMGFLVHDIITNNDTITRDMAAKREALIANTMKRKGQLGQKFNEIELQNSERKLEEQRKFELAEQKKAEKEHQRQRILDEYQRKKAEQAALEMSLSGSSSTLTPRLDRGRSQGPVVRPKSQMFSSEFSLKNRAKRPQSSAFENSNSQDANLNAVENSSTICALKLFSKTNPKSNRNIIINALQYSVFSGTVHLEIKAQVQQELAKSDSRHFLVLFRDQKYRQQYNSSKA